MANPYENELIEQMRESLCGEGCRSDWQEFWGVIRQIDDNIGILADVYRDEDELVEKLQEFALNTRADLPSIENFIRYEARKELGND